MNMPILTNTLVQVCKLGILIQCAILCMSDFCRSGHICMPVTQTVSITCDNSKDHMRKRFIPILTAIVPQ